MKRAHSLGAALAVFLAVGCSGGGSGASSSAGASSTTNVLTAAVSFVAPAAGSVQVTSSGGGELLRTPWRAVAAGPGTITVVGLRAETSYAHEVAFVDSGGTTTLIARSTSSTPRLPTDLQEFRMDVASVASGPEDGYLLVSGVGHFQLAFDQGGALRWYERLDPTTQECKMQYDGSFTAFVGTSTGFQPAAGRYVRFRADGAVIASYTTATDPTEPGDPTVYCDNHELLVTQDASGAEKLHLLGYELRPSASGGVAAWHEILRQAPDGTVEFRWKTWDVFSESDSLESIPGGTDVDHANALAIAPDGDYLASFRDLDEVAKIDSTTGAVLWHLGGKHNQFTFRGDPLGGFSGQHSVQALPNGDVLLYDDGVAHQPPESRAVEYALDASAMTATLVWEFRHAPALYTEYVGSVERLASGDTLVAFAGIGVVDEVSPSGALLWEGRVTKASAPLFAYRIRRLPSLYDFQTP